MIRKVCAVFLTAVLAATTLAGPSNPLEAFKNPPAAAKPWVFWFWMHGNVTREGLTADLEAMAAAGIGGAVIMQVRILEVAGPVAFNSPEFFAMYEHAAKEAGRLGLQISVHPLEGWCALGGPWNSPAQSMKKIVWTESVASGPGKIRLALPQPETAEGFYKDISVIAVPAAADAALTAGVTTSAGKKGKALADGAQKTAVRLPKGKQWIEFKFPEARTCRSLVVEFDNSGRDRGIPIQCAVMVPGADGTWQAIANGRMAEKHRYGIVDSLTFAFDPVKTPVLRLELQSASPMSVARVRIFETDRVDAWERKAGMAKYAGRVDPADTGIETPPSRAIPKGRVLDLTKSMQPDGTLEWNAPPGNWDILRVGFTSTGANNKPSSDAGRGLEADKMSREAVSHHIDSFGRKLIDQLKTAAPGVVNSIHTDSWEVGPQTWTDDFIAAFRKLRGYDPVPYLPALAGGAAVGSRMESNRFLWDVRRTWADLIKTDFFEELRDISHGMGILYQSESTGTQMTHCDPINYNSVVDIPVGEFWQDGTFIHPDCKIAATVANTYQKPIVGAEAYTAMIGRWKEDPASLKALGDKAFCTGINRYIIHRYAHQPWLDYAPGMNFGPYGLNYERTVTWWKPAAGAWNQYIARCSALLQQGHTVADVAVLLADDIPTKLGFRKDIWDPIPAGVDYDGFNLELLGRLTVDAQGMLTLPHGPRYRVLLLPDDRLMRPETLREISRLVKAGATVIGPRPLRSPSLTGFPACDAEVASLAAELWGTSDGKTITEHRAGKGRVIWGRPLAEVLAEYGAPDFGYTASSADAEINYIHRRTADAEIYFVANSKNRHESAICRFRVSGKAPEILDPVTGTITRPALYRVADGVTKLPMNFGPSGSAFVIFRKPQTAPPLVDVSRDGKSLWGPGNWPMPEITADGTVMRLRDRGGYTFQAAAGTSLEVKPVALPDPLKLDGDWTLHFPPNQGAPDKVGIAVPGSWTQHPDDGVKHFSGTATYRKSFELTADSLAPGREWHLDLGMVKNVAEVSVNGRVFPVLWQPPFRVDVTTALKPGANDIAIAVTNLWLNRLIGDEKFHPLESGFQQYGGIKSFPDWVKAGQPPPGGRTTFATWRLVGPTNPLVPSGLLSPVALRPVQRVALGGTADAAD